MAKTYCDNCNITHTPLMCFYKPRKRINQHGKQYQTWQDTRNLWIARNPANKYGFWECALHISPNCLGQMDKDQLTLDHIVPRSHDPSLRYKHSNLQPACWYCNSMKGSKSIVD